MDLYKTLRVTVPIDIIIKTSIWRRAKLVLIVIPNLEFAPNMEALTTERFITP